MTNLCFFMYHIKLHCNIPTPCLNIVLNFEYILMTEFVKVNNSVHLRLIHTCSARTGPFRFRHGNSYSTIILPYRLCIFPYHITTFSLQNHFSFFVLFRNVSRMFKNFSISDLAMIAFALNDEEQRNEPRRTWIHDILLKPLIGGEYAASWHSCPLTSSINNFMFVNAKRFDSDRLNG